MFATMLLAGIFIGLPLIEQLSAQQEQVAIFGEAAWLPQYFYQIGFNVNSKLVLARQESAAGPQADLLLQFNQAQDHDETGNYQIVGHPLYTHEEALFGRAAGLFQGEGGLSLRPGLQTFLGRDSISDDFTISFWFRPNFLEDGEILFEWEGRLQWNDQAIPQRIMAIFRGNRLVWQFRNVFLAPPLNPLSEFDANEPSVYEVSSAPYLPETWYYHRLRYDAEQAMLEVSTDERPEDIIYTTVNREPGGVRTSLLLSNPELSSFSIGSRYFGLMETWELSLAKRRQTPLFPSYYPSGYGYSRILDLGNRSAQIRKIQLHGQTPEDSQLLLYYVLSNDHNDFLKPQSLEWKRLQERSRGQFVMLPNIREANTTAAKNANTVNMIGQYIQFKIELFSDSKSQSSPSVSGLELFYEDQALPSPPFGIQIDNYRKGGSYIEWQASPNEQILGYKIFVGSKSTEYLEPGYPVDVGAKTSFWFQNLQPKVQYYFVIASYDKYGRTGHFSKEYSIRYIPE